MIRITKNFHITILLLSFSCEEAKYELDNPYDPANMDLDPPAVFFHPPVVEATFSDSISVEIYGLELEPAAGAHLRFDYDPVTLEYDTMVPGPFFKGDNDPVAVADTSEGTVDVFIYYLPDMESNQNEGGTWSIATIYFIAENARGCSLEWDKSLTTLRDENNLEVTINDFGNGWVNIKND